MLPFNPWVLLGALIGVLLLCGTSYEYGHKHGVAAQSTADQAQFDRINAGLARQKEQAAADMQAAQAQIIETLAQRDSFKHQLEKAHVANQDTTNKLRAALADRGLRFRTAESGGSGCGSQGTGSPEGQPASATSTTVVQLPAEVTTNLRQLAFDADQLADEYRLCHAYALGNTKGPAP